MSIKQWAGNHGSSALHHAVESSHDECAHMLLHTGADVNAQGESHSTPLSVAVAQGDKNMVQLLLDYGANVYDVMSAPLEIAVVQCKAEIFQLLLEGGEAGPFTDRSVGYAESAINSLPSGKWVYRRILQLHAGRDFDADDFTESGPYADPSAARRDRDELFIDVLSGSTTQSEFIGDLVNVAIEEMGPIVVDEILSTSRHNSNSEHEILEQKQIDNSSPSEVTTA